VHFTLDPADGNLGAGSGHPHVLDLTGCGCGYNFAPAPNPHRDGFERGFSLALTGDPMGARKSTTIFFTRYPGGPTQLGAHLNEQVHASLCIL
jgi:hypothetical protein